MQCWVLTAFSKGNFEKLPLAKHLEPGRIHLSMHDIAHYLSAYLIDILFKLRITKSSLRKSVDCISSPSGQIFGQIRLHFKPQWPGANLFCEASLWQSRLA